MAVGRYKKNPAFARKQIASIVAKSLLFGSGFAFIIATLAIIFPAFGFAPRLYEWTIHQRLRKLYRPRFRRRCCLNQISAELSAYNYRNHVQRLSNGAH